MYNTYDQHAYDQDPHIQGLTGSVHDMTYSEGLLPSDIGPSGISEL